MFVIQIPTVSNLKRYPPYVVRIEKSRINFCYSGLKWKPGWFNSCRVFVRDWYSILLGKTAVRFNFKTMAKYRPNGPEDKCCQICSEFGYSTCKILIESRVWLLVNFGYFFGFFFKLNIQIRHQHEDNKENNFQYNWET